jgi:hypothetical protein
VEAPGIEPPTVTSVSIGLGGCGSESPTRNGADGGDAGGFGSVSIGARGSTVVNPEPIARALDVAARAWDSSRDRAALRKSLVRLLGMLDEEDDMSR